MSSFDNIKTGPCELLWDSVSLGYTEGDVTFNDGLETRERMAAHYGENVIDLIGLGQKPTVTVRLAEPTLANLRVWMPEAVVETNTLHFGKKPGWKASQYAKALILRPLKATGTTEDICLHKAVVQKRAEVGLNSEDDRVYEVTFLGLVDESKADGKLLGYMNIPTGS